MKRMIVDLLMTAALVLLIFAGMIGSAVSGAVLSRYALDFLPIRGGRAWAREVHMLCAYWGLVLMSLHLGLHAGQDAENDLGGADMAAADRGAGGGPVQHTPSPNRTF